MTHAFLATCPAGVGVYLAQELEGLGAQQIVERPVGVSFEGGLGLAYRACLWSRMANRIILQLGAAQADSADELYEATRQIDWTAHLAATSSLLVDFAGRSADVRNAQFGAQRIKDAIVDQFREKGMGRPSVDLKQPDVRVFARLSKGRLMLGIDLSGDSLHRRGYRLDGGWRRSEKILPRQHSGPRAGRKEAGRERLYSIRCVVLPRFCWKVP